MAELMLKKVRLANNIVFVLIGGMMLMSCKTTDSERGCNENPHFKERFFFYIDNVETRTVHNVKYDKIRLTLALNDSSLMVSLHKLSRYVEVNYPILLNYSFGYPSKESFYEDKKRWIQWYQEHKCENLQWIE